MKLRWIDQIAGVDHLCLAAVVRGRDVVVMDASKGLALDVDSEDLAELLELLPTHLLVAGQLLTVTRKEWVAGDFELFGAELDLSAGGRPTWVVIEAPDGCWHRPMTDLELAMLQGLPVWHRPGDPTELAIGAEGGQWLMLEGNKAQRREQIGNAVPPAAAQAIAERVLELLDAGDEQVFRLSSAGVWVHPIRRARHHRPRTDHAQHQHA